MVKDHSPDAIEAALNRMLMFPQERESCVGTIDAVLASRTQEVYSTRVANAAVAAMLEGAKDPSLDSVIKASSDVLSAMRTGLPSNAFESIVRSLRMVQSRPIAAFHVMDATATLCADNAGVRTVLGELGLAPVLLDVARANKRDLNVLFGVAFTAVCFTMADVVNGGRMIDANGLQVLIEIFKSAARVSAAAAGVDSGLKQDVMKYAKQAILNLTKVPFDSANAAFGSANWGRFGDLIDVDELKLDVEKERKRCLSLLSQFRAAKQNNALSSAPPAAV